MNKIYIFVNVHNHDMSERNLCKYISQNLQSHTSLFGNLRYPQYGSIGTRKEAKHHVRHCHRCDHGGGVSTKSTRRNGGPKNGSIS